MACKSVVVAVMVMTLAAVAFTGAQSDQTPVESTPTAPVSDQSRIEALEAENLALRRQLAQQHGAIGELQRAMGGCNVELSKLAVQAIDANEKAKTTPPVAPVAPAPAVKSEGKPVANGRGSAKPDRR